MSFHLSSEQRRALRGATLKLVEQLSFGPKTSTQLAHLVGKDFHKSLDRAREHGYVFRITQAPGGTQIFRLTEFRAPDVANQGELFNGSDEMGAAGARYLSDKKKTR